MITQAEAIAALDDAMKDEIKQYFSHLIGNVAGDGLAQFKGDAERFRTGITQLRQDYQGAQAIIAEVFK